MLNKYNIGFNCSTFDLFHAGHILMLEEAREQCLEYDAVLTAGPHHDEVSDFNHPIHKVVQFSDTAYEKSGGPTLENVVELIEFGAGVPKLLVHCHAGISRSTATAWGVAIANGNDPLDAFLYLQKVTQKIQQQLPSWE